MGQRKSCFQRQSGQIMALFLLASLAIMAMFALVVDGGNMFIQLRTAQNAADSGALAGAYYLAHNSSGTAIAQDICTYAQDNQFGEVPTITATLLPGATSISLNNCQSPYPSNTLGSASAVQVTATISNFSTYLAGILGLSSFNASGQATATVQTTTSTAPDAMYALSPSACPGIYLEGNSSVSITGAVQDNSAAMGPGTCPGNPSESDALEFSGNSSVSATSWNVVGAADGCPSGGCGTVHTGSSSVPDPFANLPVPIVSGLTTHASVGTTTSTGTCPAGTVSAGYYPVFNVTGCSSLTFGSGDYEFGYLSITGSSTVTFSGTSTVVLFDGMTMSGNSTVTGSNTMFYNACSEYYASPGACPVGGTFGAITITSDSDWTVTPQSTGTYKNMLFFQDRNNTQPFKLDSVSTFATGTIYGSQMPVTIHTDSAASNDEQWIAASYSITNNSTFNVGPNSAEETPGAITTSVGMTQ